MQREREKDVGCCMRIFFAGSFVCMYELGSRSRPPDR